MRLTARWIDQAALRTTPAGVPALDLTLEHQGQAMEAGHPRRVILRLHAVALGELARRLPQLGAGDLFLWTGFLAPGRNGKGVVFHLSDVEPVQV
ncbi:primosomal replication protein N [Inhella sp.]|uniref:primosomal replication protein N n=1 Tax=Inhella sp. TaxID=1921806 RepID=UPI0035B3233E